MSFTRTCFLGKVDPPFLFSNIVIAKVLCLVIKKQLILIFFFAVKREIFCPFQDFQGPQPKFKDFPEPGILICQFQDFAGYLRTVATLVYVLFKNFNAKNLLLSYLFQKASTGF